MIGPGDVVAGFLAFVLLVFFILATVFFVAGVMRGGWDD